ncbi:hypothetical protein RFI_19684 [Reticulomyxa filosa]|uniref:Uncharacterized protein n=1 Tax=Reticulomyxa filosa TaxID=46433 RepID=X6MUH3_RETFI|nr:hypothetical protein RFI_19684 [Reticulomyxa filosa]|eukprot:ETO17638.1 hypothetical protein RFI_19684 [Reticulomyxa filosa]
MALLFSQNSSALEWFTGVYFIFQLVVIAPWNVYSYYRLQRSRDVYVQMKTSLLRSVILYLILFDSWVNTPLILLQWGTQGLGHKNYNAVYVVSLVYILCYWNLVIVLVNSHSFTYFYKFAIGDYLSKQELNQTLSQANVQSTGNWYIKHKSLYGHFLKWCILCVILSLLRGLVALLSIIFFFF